jgi:ferredoxin
LQDLVSRLRIWTKKGYRFRFHRPQHLLRYAFLGIAVIFLLAGSMIGISLLDPYSIFGRVASEFFQPAFMWGNNRLAALLESLQIYALFPEDLVVSPWQTYLVPAGTLVIVAWMSFARGRLYCNTVCPVGTLLGFLSRISLFRIRMLEDRCTKCGECAVACKAECIRVKDLEVDFTRCVACYNCISVCPEDAILYQYGSKNRHAEEKALQSAGPDTQGRREAISKLVYLGLLTGGFRKWLAGDIFRLDHAQDPVPEMAGDSLETVIQNKIPTRIPVVKHFPVTPPGSLGIRHYTQRCTSCHLCISACPTDVLQPSVGKFGWAGFQQPHMDYSTNYCNFDCVICSEVCPSGAILSLASEAKKTLQLGQVQLILENCVVYAEHTACGSCSEHCPTQAVTMVPYVGGLTLPEIKPDICVGCGACEYACPVTPHKAIFVDGHEVHQAALEPTEEALEQPDLEEEFPF